MSEELLELLRLEATLREVLDRHGKDFAKILPPDTRDSRVYGHLFTILRRIDALRQTKEVVPSV